MDLAKDALDVGLLTDDEAMLDFLGHDVGLGEPERLRIGPGVMQHRFEFHASVVKLNLVEELPTQSRSGYASVVLAGGPGEPRTLEGPDGVVVEVARPSREVERLGVRLRVPDLARALRYFTEGLGWQADGSVVRCGSTALLLAEDAEAPSEVRMPVRGWTYLTVQIFDCDAVTAELLSRGVELGAPARTLGDVARFSMVADPWGNQLEISERASLTGRPPGSGR